MFNKAVGVLAIAVLLLGVVVFPGCKSQPGDGTESAPEQRISVSGAWALYPMMVSWSEGYKRLHPEVRIDVSAGGAGKGAADALGGLVDLGMISREIKPEEISQGAVFVPVVKDAVFPTINAANPALSAGLAERGVKRQQLVELFLQGRAQTWGELAGTDQSDPVQVYTRSDSCGAAETWTLYLGGKGQEELQGIGVYGDPGVAEAVRKDRLGLGYNNLNFVFDSQTGTPLQGMAVLPLDINENGLIDPEERLDTKAAAMQAVASGLYPAPPARDLYLLTKGEFSGPAREFVLWILTDGQALVSEVGYISLTAEQLQAAQRSLGQGK